MRVLVVEDEKKTASFVRKALESEGFAVGVCHRGDDAMRQLLLNLADSTVEGCGLGLSIAQWIATAHRGEIYFSSEPDQLTTVSVRLPLA